MLICSSVPLQELGDLFERYASGAACCAAHLPAARHRPGNRRPLGREAAGASCAGTCASRASPSPTIREKRGPVIREFSLDVPAGQRVAIVGPTGHGKSTLVQLLTRFYEPQQGRVLLDGEDIQTLSQKGASPRDRRRLAGQRALQRQHPREPAHRRAGRGRFDHRDRTRAISASTTLIRRLPHGYRHPGRSPRREPQPRPAPNRVPGARLPLEPLGVGARRSDLRGRRADRAAHPACSPSPLRRAHRDHHRAPASRRSATPIASR